MVAAFGGGAALSGGVFTAPTYVIRGGSYSDAGSAFAAVDSALSGLDSRVSTLEALPPGGTGAAGASAYDIAVAAGVSGTEQQWLASLVGPQGSPGETGAQRPQGGTGAIDRKSARRQSSHSSA